MKLSAMNSHYRFYTLEYFFETIAKIGFKYCEIWTSPHHFYVDSYQSEDPNKLVSLAQKFNIEIICICPEQTNPKPHNIATSDTKAQKRVFSYFTSLIDIAAKVGCYKLVVTSGWVFYNEDREKAYENSVAMMKSICEYATKKEVVLAMEALQVDESILVNSITDLKQYRNRVGYDCLKICLDMGAMARSKETISDYFTAFGDEIVHVHFVDGDPVGHLAWGDGNRNLKDDLKSFKFQGYLGYLSLETATGRYFEAPYKSDTQTLELVRKTEKFL